MSLSKTWGCVVSRAAFGDQSRCLFIGQQGFALAFKPDAIGDVADVALDDSIGTFLIDVSDDFNGVAAANAIFQGEILKPKRPPFVQFLHRILIGGFVSEDADLPEFLADEVGARVIQQFKNERIDIGNPARVGIEDKNPIMCGLEQSAIAEFRDFEQALGLWFDIGMTAIIVF